MNLTVYAPRFKYGYDTLVNIFHYAKIDPDRVHRIITPETGPATEHLKKWAAFYKIPITLVPLIYWGCKNETPIERRNNTMLNQSDRALFIAHTSEDWIKKIRVKAYVKGIRFYTFYTFYKVNDPWTICPLKIVK